MRSDSLIRLDAQEQAGYSANEALRAEIERQTQEFLASGGQVKEVPSSLYDKAWRRFNRDEVIDPISRKVVSRASREIVAGRMVLRMSALEFELGISSTKIRKLINQGKFPSPLYGIKPQAWDEEQVRGWAQSNV